MTVTDFTEKYISQAQQLEKLCFSAPWTEQNFLDTLNNGHSIFLAAFSAGEFAGYISADTVCGTAYINNIAVKPQFRRKGAARALINELERRAVESNCFEMTLEVRSKNLPALALYEKCGFETAGKRQNFYRHPDDDGIIMTKKL